MRNNNYNTLELIKLYGQQYAKADRNLLLYYHWETVKYELREEIENQIKQ